jgi:CheY-like chemotaxis protein
MSQGGAKVIIVAEDQDYLQRMYDMMLTHEGYSIKVFSDRQSAFDEVKANPPDLLLTDNKMPNAGDGLELIKDVRGILPDLPIVMVTSDGNIEQQGANHGVDVYISGVSKRTGPKSVPVLSKPTNLDDLRVLIADEIILAQGQSPQTPAQQLLQRGPTPPGGGTGARPVSPP